MHPTARSSPRPGTTSPGYTLSNCAVPGQLLDQVDRAVPGPYPPNHLHTAPVLLLVHLRGQPILFPHSQLQLRPNLVLLCHLQGHHPHFIWPNCVLHNQALRAVHRLKRVINESCDIVQTRECESMLPSHEPMLAGFSLTLSQPTNDPKQVISGRGPFYSPKAAFQVLTTVSKVTSLAHLPWSVRYHLPHPSAAVHFHNDNSVHRHFPHPPVSVHLFIAVVLLPPPTVPRSPPPPTCCGSPLSCGDGHLLAGWRHEDGNPWPCISVQSQEILVPIFLNITRYSWISFQGWTARIL